MAKVCWLYRIDFLKIGIVVELVKFSGKKKGLVIFGKRYRIIKIFL